MGTLKQAVTAGIGGIRTTNRKQRQENEKSTAECNHLVKGHKAMITC